MNKGLEYIGDYVRHLEEQNAELQQEIKRQSKAQCILDNEIYELQTKIDKAIEYIKENTDNTNFIEVPSIELLEILEDKETEEIPRTLEQLNNLSIIGDKESE